MPDYWDLGGPAGRQAAGWRALLLALATARHMQTAAQPCGDVQTWQDTQSPVWQPAVPNPPLPQNPFPPLPPVYPPIEGLPPHALALDYTEKMPAHRGDLIVAEY